MGISDKAKFAAQNVKGKAREAAGHVTGDHHLKAEGKGDQAAAKMKHAADQALEAAKHAAQSAKGKAKEAAGHVTGKDHLKAEGKADQAAAAAKEKFNK